MLTLAGGSATLQGALRLTPTTPAVTCSTATGPGTAATVVVKPGTTLAGSTTQVVSLGAITGGLVVTAPTIQTLSASNQAAGITYTINIAAGCVGATTGTGTFVLNVGGSLDTTVSVTTTVNATVSGLSATPSPIVLTCAKSGSTYTPGAAKTVSVTSTLPGGTAFTVDTSTAPPPAWLTVTPTTGGTATSTAVTFTLAAAAGCGSFAAGSTTNATVHLLNSPSPDKLVAVSLQILSPSPLTANPTSASLTYVKGSGTPGFVDVNFTASVTPAPFVVVDTSTLPIWLTVDQTSGSTPKKFRFSTTSIADTLPPGNISAMIAIKVSGYADLAVPVTLQLNNKAPRLSVAEGTTRNISWTFGSPVPTATITAVSSDTPISYSVATGGTLAPIIPSVQQTGYAYSFGTPLNVTFNPLLFAAAQPGTVLTGTVTLTWGSPASTIVVTFAITVQSAGATVSGVSPASLPTAASGQTFSVVLSGSGFVGGTDPTQKTKVGVVVGNAIVTDTNISTNVVNPSNIILTVTVPVASDPYLPFSPTGAGGSVALGVCNPSGATCSIPTGTATLSIGSNPIVQTVTSASSFVQATPPAYPIVSPYDLLSIFGTNFCSSGGTGCSSSQIMAGTPDPVTLVYPSALTPDTTGTVRNLSVTFQTHGGSPTLIATAPLLFASNGQINLIAPSALSSSVGQTVDMVVSFGYGSGATLKSSAPFPVTVAATNPGVFTIGASGQGDGAILSSSYAVVGQSNPAGIRTTSTDSDTVLIYVTGLGAPTSSADNATAGTSGGAIVPTDCVSTSSFLTSLNAAAGSSLTSLTGAVMQSSLLNTHRVAPCFVSNPSVRIGGIAATVTYAGWVADSVGGLYQINARLPSRASAFTTVAGASVNPIVAPVQLPVTFTSNSVTSQGGVSMWVAPSLMVAPPSGAGLAGTVGVAWASSNNLVVATEGTSSYRYAISSGVLPSGVTLNPATGAISGIPAANTSGSYIVTVTATDSSNIPVSGSVTFTLTVAGGLYLTSSNTPPFAEAFGTADPTVTTVQAAGGIYPYVYAITAPVSVPAGLAIDPATGVLSTTALTPAGTYVITITATDSTSGTPLTGTITFTLVVT